MASIFPFLHCSFPFPHPQREEHLLSAFLQGQPALRAVFFLLQVVLHEQHCGLRCRCYTPVNVREIIISFIDKANRSRSKIFSHHFSINTCSGFLDNFLIFRRFVLGNYGTVLCTPASFQIFFFFFFH